MQKVLCLYISVDLIALLITNSSVDLIYTDIAKAFDSVSHPKLIFVLSFYGITGNLLKRIECFLTNRTQLVYVNNQ